MSWPSSHEILTGLQSAVLQTRPDGRLVDWSEGATRLFGLKPEDRNQALFWERFEPAIRRRLQEQINRPDFEALSGYECRDCDPQGNPRWLRYDIRWLRNRVNHPCGLIITVDDITPYKTEAIQDRLEQDSSLNTFADGMTDAIVAVTNKGNVLVYNRAAEKIFGFDRSAILNYAIDQLPGLAGVLQQHQAESAAAGRPSFQSVHRIQSRRASGESFPAELTATSFARHGCQLISMGVRDISRMRQMERALHQAQKTQAIGGLARGVAHDFNNILTAILSHLELIDTSGELPESLGSFVTHARTSARRGAELVNRLLTFSRQSAPKLIPMPLDAVIDEVLAVLHRSVGHTIQIIPEFVPEDIWMVNADSSQIMQVLMNLCLNARDSMPEGGELSIWLENVTIPAEEALPPRKAGDYVKMTVKDTGKGIAKDILDRLCEPYFTTKAFGKGVGLGLSIVQNIIAQHAGWLEVESKINSGSRFQVFLPRAQAPSGLEASRRTPTRVDAEPDKLEGTETILIVDDEELIRLVSKTVLNYRGYKVIEAETGEDALEVYRQESGNIDLVLLDVYMTGISGWKTLTEIRKINPQAAVVMMSGGKMDELTCEETDETASGCLSKPFENTTLAQTVRKILDKSQKPRP